MRKVKGFSAGNEFAQIVLEDGTLWRIRRGDDWNVPYPRDALSAQAREIIDLGCNVQALQDELKRVKKQSDDLRKRNTHLEKQRNAASRAERKQRWRAEYTERKLAAAVSRVKHFDKKSLIEPEVQGDGANRITAERLNGKSVTIHLPTYGDSDQTKGAVCPTHVAEAIRDEYGVLVNDVHIDFPVRNELGVWDAGVRIGGYPATVKVWIVSDKFADSRRFSRGTPAEVNEGVSDNRRQIWEAIRDLARSAVSDPHGSFSHENNLRRHDTYARIRAKAEVIVGRGE